MASSLTDLRTTDRCLSTHCIYDSIAIILSLTDQATDIYILYQFYQLNRLTFFYIGLTILLIAQLCFLILFSVRFIDFDFGRSSWKWLQTTVHIFMASMCTPLLGMIIFLADREGSRMANFLTFLGIGIK